jgi:hypothetical protein
MMNIGPVTRTYSIEPIDAPVPRELSDAREESELQRPPSEKQKPQKVKATQQ